MKNKLIEFGRHLVENNIIHKVSTDETTHGKSLIINGKNHLNFGSCSYIGLEKHPKIQEEAIKAINNHGTLFSSSRTYVSLNLFENLESLIRQIFNREHVAIFSSITLGHMAVLPAILEKNDVIIYDQQAHYSMQSLHPILKSRGVIVDIVKHNNLEKLEAKIIDLNEKYNPNKIWYAIDGVYSMYGDVPDYDGLKQLQTKFKNLYFYIDDAHGMSWAGKNGCGYANANIELNERIVLCVSFSKAYGTGGCAFLFPNNNMLEEVLFAGGNFTFTIPMYPPIIGAAIGSAKVHLSKEIYELQNTLEEKIKWRNELLKKYNLPHCSNDNTPICFVPVGNTKACMAMAMILSEQGIHANMSTYPAVPENYGGIRFTITNHNSFEDIEYLIKTLKDNLSVVLGKFDSSIQDLNKTFRRVKSYVPA